MFTTNPRIPYQEILDCDGLTTYTPVRETCPGEHVIAVRDETYVHVMCDYDNTAIFEARGNNDINNFASYLKEVFNVEIVILQSKQV